MWKNRYKDRTMKSRCIYLQLGTWEEFQLYTQRLMARLHLNLVAAPNGKDQSRQLLYELTRYPTCNRWTLSNKHPHAVITYFSLQTHLLSVISQTVVCLMLLHTIKATRGNKNFTSAQFDLLFKQLYFIYYGLDWLDAAFMPRSALRSIVVRLLRVGPMSAIRQKKKLCFMSTEYLMFLTFITANTNCFSKQG